MVGTVFRHMRVKLLWKKNILGSLKDYLHKQTNKQKKTHIIKKQRESQKKIFLVLLPRWKYDNKFDIQYQKVKETLAI